MKKIAIATLMSLVAVSAMAQASPAGLWKTIDDDTKKEKSLVRISESNGVFSGRIEKLLDPETKQDAVCEDCSDERKGKPVLGMTILRNLKQNVEDKAIFDGGDVLDPKNGKVYRARLRPVDGGKKLEMRGYVGPFYRTQVWLRVE
ncbi:MAG: DUF2147 domain-containing protein [Hydrogenophaga sp.]|nr:DUF2147 domain-containing protein [Hydrogenophaga sp.]